MHLCIAMYAYRALAVRGQGAVSQARTARDSNYKQEKVSQLKTNLCKRAGGEERRRWERRRGTGEGEMRRGRGGGERRERRWRAERCWRASLAMNGVGSLREGELTPHEAALLAVDEVVCVDIRRATHV